MSVDLKELVAAAVSGDKNAYAMIYKLTFKSSYYIALKLTGKKEQALEAVENAYSTAFEIISRNNAPDDVENWLKRLVTVKCDFSEFSASSFEAESSTLAHTVSVEDGMEFLPVQLLQSKKGVEFILNTVNGLPENQRTVVWLRYYSDLTAENIAKVLSCSEDSVNSVLYHVREKIKNEAEAFLGEPLKFYRQGDVAVLSAIINYEKKFVEADAEDFKKVFRVCAEKSGVNKVKPVEQKPEIKPVTVVPAEAPEIKKIEAVKKESIESDEKPKKKGSSAKIIAVIVAAVVLIAGIAVAAGFIISSLNDKPDPANAPEEIIFEAHIETAPEGYAVIKNADDLANIKNNLSGKYILMNDIDLKGVDWEPIGTITMGKEGCFSGVFDGNGYEIKNLSTNGYDYAGLFGTVYNGSVVNVTISSAKISGNTSAGAVAGECWIFEDSATSVISNCRIISGEIYAERYAGGIAGNVVISGEEETADGLISKYCSNSASVSADKAGGIFGNVSMLSDSYVIINDVVNYGDICGTTCSAGLISSCEITSGSVEVYDSLNLGNVNNQTHWNTQAVSGAIVGTCDGEKENSLMLFDCYYLESKDVSGTVSAKDAVVKDRLVALNEENADVKETYYSVDFDAVWHWDGKAEKIQLSEFVVSYPIMKNQIQKIVTSEPEVEITAEPEEESIVASQEDFDAFLDMFDNFYLSLEDYNVNHDNAQKVAYEILFNDYFTERPYSYFFNDSYYSQGESDPLDKLYNGSYYEFCSFPAENADWIITNVFGVEPDHNLDDGMRYYYDGRYYVITNPGGANFVDFTIENSELNSNGLYVFDIVCDITVMGDEEPTERETYKAEAQLKEVDGKRIWAIHSIEFVSMGEINSEAENWEIAYNAYLKEDYDSRDSSDTEQMSFSLAYITDDDIPELLISEGDYNAAQVTVVTYNGSETVELGRYGYMGTLEYIERENVIVGRYSKSGRTTTSYYSINGDFSVEKELTAFNNAAEFDDESEITFRINDVDVTEEEYAEAVSVYESRNIVYSDEYGYSYDYDSFDNVF